MSNDLKSLPSAKVDINGIWVGEHLLRKYSGEYTATFEFDYYKVKTRDDCFYKIDFDEYTRITNAINDGAKFVELEGDLVNINYIDKIEKKIGYK